MALIEHLSLGDVIYRQQFVLPVEDSSITQCLRVS